MYWLYGASVITGLTAFVHIFGGGKSVAKPLLESLLDDEAKYTNYYCWHMVTIIIVVMCVCFFLAAGNVEYRELGILSCVLSFAFAIWSGILIYIKRKGVFELPQWVLFLPIAIVSFIGLFQA